MSPVAMEGVESTARVPEFDASARLVRIADLFFVILSPS